MLFVCFPEPLGRFPFGGPTKSCGTGVDAVVHSLLSRYTGELKRWKIIPKAEVIN